LNKINLSTKIASSPVRIAIISFFILTLELTFIRQIPAEVRSISYFTNLILMASFFGLGLGCILSRGRRLLFLLPVGLFLMAVFIFIARGIVIYEEAKTVHYWLQYSNISGQALRLPLFAAAAIVFILSAVPFVALGQNLASTMDKFPRLTAYSWDIAGSLLGTLIFFLSAYLGIPPWVWIPLGTGLWSYFILKSRKSRTINILISCLFLLFASSPNNWTWSPYYFIQYKTDEIGTNVWVNSSFHQLAVNFKNKNPKFKQSFNDLAAKFSFPYDIYRQYHNGEPPESVLILGAGTGNDIVVAEMNNVQKITAVEIDPVILKLGRELNTSQPYQEANVRAVVDDARHYIRNCSEKYDLIILATLDSQTLLAGQANLRLENYVYTKESFFDIKNLLNDKGLLASYYSVFKPWLYDKIYSTVSPAFSPQLRLYKMDTPYLFNTIIIGATGITEFNEDINIKTEYKAAVPADDDWPFLYIEHPMLPRIYIFIAVFIFLLALGVFFILRKREKLKAGLKLNYLFLGLGFALTESAAVVRLALLFGNTWVTYAFVFSSVLFMIFLANLLVMKKAILPLWLAWAGLGAGILVNYFFPLRLFLEFNFLPRILLSIIFIGLPVFFAAVCFSKLFKKENFSGYALGMNLIGAMLGGLLEYLSMLIGMRNVWLIALAVYLGAYLTTYFKVGRATALFSKKQHRLD